MKTPKQILEETQLKYTIPDNLTLPEAIDWWYSKSGGAYLEAMETYAKQMAVEFVHAWTGIDKEVLGVAYDECKKSLE